MKYESDMSFRRPRETPAAPVLSGIKSLKDFPESFQLKMNAETKGYPMSIDDMLEAYPLSPFCLTKPTDHASSLFGGEEVVQSMYQGLEGFIFNPDGVAFAEETFAVTSKSFNGRPPFTVDLDAAHYLTGENDYKYRSNIFTGVQNSFFLVLRNEISPIGYAAINQFSDGLEVKVLQGIKGEEARRDLGQLGHWRERMLTYIEGYANDQEMKYSMIIPASENIWVDPKKFPLERAQRIYDDLAMKCGYKHRKNIRRFIKQLRD